MTATAPRARRPAHAQGLLGSFAEAGVLESADVHVAQRVARLGGEVDESVALAAALAVRAVRHGSVCLDLAQAHHSVAIEDTDPDALALLQGLRWPEVAGWTDRLAGSPVVTGLTESDDSRPLRLVGTLLYLDRYWRQESVIAQAVDERRARPAPVVDEPRLRAALGRLFADPGPDRQRLAAAVAVQRWVSVLAGGPGTGKTTTVAKLLGVLRDQPGPVPRIALAAPTGKAAARLEEAVRGVVAGFARDDQERLGDLTAMTLHRLLGWTPNRTRFVHHRDNRLPYDFVVVDEASMVSLTLMARLVDALRPDARLVLVGDPDQLASVEAGAVLADLVARPAPHGVSALQELDRLLPADLADLDAAEQLSVRVTGVVTLTQVHRHGGHIKSLAEAIKAGRPDAVLDLLLSSGGGVELVEPDDLDATKEEVVAAGSALEDCAEAGDQDGALAALDRHRLLCAHRTGPFGVTPWSRQIEEWLREARPAYGRGGLWYLGRPLLVTSNDRELGLFNGDTGVVVDVAGQPMAVFPKGSGAQVFPTHRLSEVTTMHAMSVHKSQGSQFDRVTLVLPDPSSPLLTKELFYTAVTRARSHVRVIGSEESVRAAVARHVQRASGLASIH